MIILVVWYALSFDADSIAKTNVKSKISNLKKKREKQMKKFIQGMYQKKNFGVRLTAVILSVIVMGFALSLLVLVDLGTDPCTSMNLAISEKIGMGIGNWQALLNTIIFVFVILLGRENIGFGTLANMFLVGYSLQFFSGYGIRSYRQDCLIRWQCVFWC